MVSLWPWKGDESSTAHFEKTLSTLNAKLSKGNAHDATLRTHARRYKVLWTLYTSFIYILYTLILFLVTGVKRWAVVEYSLVVGGPIVIFTVRTALDTYYNYRIANNSGHIKTLQAQRRQAIDKFKHATRYDSTQQLLEKYGADKGKSSETSTAKDTGRTKKSRDSSGSSTARQPPAARTNIPPPATANIRRPADGSTPSQSPVAAQGSSSPSSPTSSGFPPGLSLTSPDSTAEFAPNAYSTPPQYAPNAGTSGPRWYDRVMDLMLGEDESKPINRLALICSHCHLVNGQAPPGVKTLGELGRWKCFSCRKWNGEENEVRRIVAAAENDGIDVPSAPSSPGAAVEGKEQQPSAKNNMDVQDREGQDEGEEDDFGDADEAPPAKSTRSQAGKAHAT